MPRAQLMVHTRRDARVFRRRADGRNKRREFRGSFSIFHTTAIQIRRRREGKLRILSHRHERIDQRTVQHLVQFVRDKENRLAEERSAKRKATYVLLKRQSRDTKRVISKCIGVECFVAEVVKTTPVKL